jgi:polyhydroxyalkanoate synthesis regulator phasin
MQSQPPQKEESAADAAKKAQKEKAKPKKVYTEEDLAGMRGNGVSVVGDDKPAGAGGAGTNRTDGKTKTGVVPMSGQDEEYWRGKASALLSRIAATEQQIAKLQDDIKKYGSGGFDVTTGRKDNIAYINDRSGQVKELEKRKADLEKQLDELQDEGRKAGASPAWFR